MQASQLKTAGSVWWQGEGSDRPSSPGNSERLESIFVPYTYGLGSSHLPLLVERQAAALRRRANRLAGRLEDTRERARVCAGGHGGEPHPARHERIHAKVYHVPAQVRDARLPHRRAQHTQTTEYSATSER